MLSRARKGFTLLELIVVIVILGILAAIAIPTFAAVIAKSKYASVRETAQATANNAVALAAFDGATVTVKTSAGTVVATAAELSYATAANKSTDATPGELPAGYTAAAATGTNSAGRFVISKDTDPTLKACVQLPTAVNGASKVSSAAVADAAACGLPATIS